MPIGTIGYHRWDRLNHIAEIGYDFNNGTALVRTKMKTSKENGHSYEED